MNLKVIEDAISKKGLKKSWVASKIEVHPGTLRRFLKGEVDMGSTKFLKLLEILNLKAEALNDRAS